MDKELIKKLSAIQTEIKAPKGQINKFGGYKYRSCEDILEALKPHLKKHEIFISLTDEVVNIGERFYVVATVKANGEVINMAMARECETKKGMDDAQLTGACSSYARKYALAGAFLLDDTKDADTMDNGPESKAKQTAKTSAKPTTTKPKEEKPLKTDPAPYMDKNPNCEKWEDWVTPKGAKLGAVADSDTIDLDQKEAGFKAIGKSLEKALSASTNEREKATIKRDISFIHEAIKAVVPF